jgi:hypothetical protein
MIGAGSGGEADRYVMLGCGREMQGFEEGLLRGW